MQDGQGDLYKRTEDNVPETKSTFFLLWVNIPIRIGAFSSSGTLLQSFLSYYVNKCLFASSSRQAFQGKIHPDGHQTKGGVSDFSKQFFKLKKLFSTMFFTDDVSSAIAHIDGISCFCWLKLLNPIGSLNPIKRFIFSDVLFKFFNYGFWILPTISILIAKPFTLSLHSSWKLYEHYMFYTFTSNEYLCYCICIAHYAWKLYFSCTAHVVDA